MTEVRTAPVAARHIADWAEFEDKYEMGNVPGAFNVDGSTFWYCCPCGCGSTGALRVGVNSKPEEAPSWSWNGSVEKPTLIPSVHHVGHWHGFLTDGVWLSC